MARFFRGPIVLFMFFMVVTPLRAEPSELEQARAFVQNLHDRAVTLEAAAHTREVEDFRQAFRDLIGEAFELKGLSRLAAGRAWETADPNQRDEYSALYTEWMVDTYRRCFTKGKAEYLTVFSAGPVAGSADHFVSARLPGGIVPTTATTRVRRIDGKLKIVDVAIWGISLIRTQRDDFAAVVKLRGFPGLLVEMRRRVAFATAELL